MSNDRPITIAETTTPGRGRALSSPEGALADQAQGITGDHQLFVGGHHQGQTAAFDGDGAFTAQHGGVVRLLVDLEAEKVILLLAEGNHDPASSVWLQTMFSALYEHEPRIEVVQTPLPYYALRHGKTALFFHHGHKKKVESLPLLFAALFPDHWGKTTKRYAHTGHLHHLHEKEHPGLKLMQHPTIAARDAHAARGGWLSERQATVITYHSEFGEVDHHVFREKEEERFS
jgi:hypothetical protein